MAETETTAGTAEAEITETETAATTVTEPESTTETESKDELGQAGKAALEKERQARKAAEKQAKEAQKRLDAIEAEKLSETERLKKDADEGKALAATATGKLRRASLITALSEEGLTGGRAKAAARLLDGVEFDADDEPTNLKDALKAAKAIYGADLFDAKTTDETIETPDLHAGARATKPDDELDISHLFPAFNKKQ